MKRKWASAVIASAMAVMMVTGMAGCGSDESGKTDTPAAEETENTETPQETEEPDASSGTSDSKDAVTIVYNTKYMRPHHSIVAGSRE